MRLSTTVRRPCIASPNQTSPTGLSALPPSGPDGMCFAENGYLLAAHYNGSGVDVFSPDGHLVDHIDIPGRFTTNCCFGGPNFSTLIVTDVDTKSLYTVELSVRGQPLNDGRSYA